MDRPIDNPEFRDRIVRELTGAGAPPDDDPRLGQCYEAQADAHNRVRVCSDDPDESNAAKVLGEACRREAVRIRAARRG